MGLQRESNFASAGKLITARVISRSPTVWYSNVVINAGSSDGVHVNDPVIAAGGLAGKVTSVIGGQSQVTLITDQSSNVSAEVMPDGSSGIVRPEVGNPDDMLLDYIQKGAKISKGDSVLTSGFTSSKLDSLFPRSIPIGRVTKVEPSELEQYSRVHIHPYARPAAHGLRAGAHRNRGPVARAGDQVILTPGAVGRLVAIVILTVVIQAAGIQGITVLGGTIDLVPLLVGAVALWGGSIAGAAVGFSCGLLIDLTLGQDVGASSLVLTAVGYFVGRYGEVNEPAHGLLPMPVAAGSHGRLSAGHHDRQPDAGLRRLAEHLRVPRHVPHPAAQHADRAALLRAHPPDHPAGARARPARPPPQARRSRSSPARSGCVGSEI